MDDEDSRIAELLWRAEAIVDVMGQDAFSSDLRPAAFAAAVDLLKSGRMWSAPEGPSIYPGITIQR